MDKILFNDFITETKERKGEYSEAINKVLDSGWFILGKEVEDFENKFAQYLGRKHVIGVANGLEALQIALMAYGIGEGDEVITTPLSAVASTLAILAVGAKPVFVEINHQGQIDASLIEEKITDKTKAILPVDLYGFSSNYDEIKKIAEKNKFLVIEDAAQAQGGYYKKQKLGTLGDTSCFSFYPTKNLGCFGDGGAIATDNEKINKVAREIRNYGQKDRYIHNRYGLNSRLDEIQAAVLKVRLNHLEEDNRKRRSNAKEYLDGLKNLNAVSPVCKSIEESNFHLFVLRVKKRDALTKYLKEHNIPNLIHYPILIPDQPFLKKEYSEEKLSRSRNFVNEIVSLPCHPWMKKNQIKYIVEKIINFYD